jgi:hypothetical protein
MGLSREYAVDFSQSGDSTMSMSITRLLLLAGAAALLPCAMVPAAAAPAKPECQQLYFEVNDYGKEGPSRDAQANLDKLIVKWTQDKGIKTYKTEKKDVSCELFLDAVVFDEYTCKATADICWTPQKTAATSAAKAEPKGAAKTQAKAAAKTEPKNAAKTDPKSTAAR